MSNGTATATAPAPAPAKKGFGLFKAVLGGGAGLATGVIGAYATAIVDQVAKPPKPVANFATSADGLTVTCQNHASGQSGWWDFGDGSPLEPFAADQPEVKHAYPKPGSYGVKLTVRNFLMEENERSVPVTVGGSSTSTSAAAGGPADGPQVVGLTVEPVGSGTAPALFKVKCEIKNAQQAFLDLGSGDRPEVIPAGGVFEKTVVYERPYAGYLVQVFALSGSTIDKQWKQVAVKPPAAGALWVGAVVTDAGTRTESKPGRMTAAVPVPAKPAGRFEKVMKVEPGWAVTAADLGKFDNKAVKNLKAEVLADRTAVKVSGEWTGSADKANQAAGGSDLLIPVQATLERAVAVSPAPQRVAAPLLAASIFDSFDSRPADWNTSQKTATLTLPPAPTGPSARRTVTLAVHETDPQGVDKVVLTVPDLTKPTDEQVVTLSNRQQQVVRWERLANNQVRVTLKPGRAR